MSALAVGFGRQVYSLDVVNKSGGLIYHQDFTRVEKKQGNDSLILASTFHGMHVMAMSSAPMNVRSPSGITTLEAGRFRLECLRTLTGTKFFVVGDPDVDGLDRLLHDIYVLYTDYVLKNPFYVTEMPIRHCESFERAVQSAVQNRLLPGGRAVVS
jgi:hypothetical protein